MLVIFDYLCRIDLQFGLTHFLSFFLTVTSIIKTVVYFSEVNFFSKTANKAMSTRIAKFDKFFYFFLVISFYP